MEDQFDSITIIPKITSIASGHQGISGPESAVFYALRETNLEAKPLFLGVDLPLLGSVSLPERLYSSDVVTFGSTSPPGANWVIGFDYYRVLTKFAHLPLPKPLFDNSSSSVQFSWSLFVFCLWGPTFFQEWWKGGALTIIVL